MADASRKKSGRSGSPDKGKMGMDAKRSGKSSSRRAPAKLDDVSDAPESGEPREQGRTRGHIIDTPAATGGSRAARPATPAKGSAARKGGASAVTAKPMPKGPRARAERDESGDTENEAWESGRQKAVPGNE
ncbi:MAG TPA: hypothetical protein VLJ39_19490 [Tepidisphaeraceae bacterium]|jgi:hypothetical protein|nr:hypothetical protein [Tepidisphaeraceae bacterium]